MTPTEKFQKEHDMGILNKLDPTKILADAIKRRMSEKAELNRMIDEMRPNIQRAYAEAYVVQKMGQAQEKGKIDALPFQEKLKLRMDKINRRMEEDRKFFAGTKLEVSA